MKRITVFLAVAVVGVALALAQTEVHSVNAVGYVKMTLNPGLSMIRDDFVTIDKSAAKPSKILGDQLPLNSSVWQWDGSQYKSAEYRLVDITPEEPDPTWVPGWANDDVISLDPGDGFWVKIPTSSPAITLTLMGEVPNNPTSTVPVGAGLNLIGYAFPVDATWGKTDLAQKAVDGDKIYLYINGVYNIDEYILRDVTPEEPDPTWVLKWGDTNRVIKVGQGFWYKRAGTATDWVEKRPYTL